MNTLVASGGAYAVAVKTKPAGLYCTVTNGTGSVANGPVNNVTISCYTCGTDCWGTDGCATAAGKCIRFTCRTSVVQANVCDSCFGWKQVTYDNWMNGGYCSDVIARYRQSDGMATHCGGAGQCCGSNGACAGGDNAWHFPNGNATWLTGPCLGCNNDTNCSFWNQQIGGDSYTRITACERQ